MAPYIIALLVVAVVWLFFSKLRLATRLSEETFVALDAEAEYEALKRDHEALLQRANELAEENVRANALTVDAASYLAMVGEQVKSTLNILLILRRGHELVASYYSDQHGEHTCCPCFLDVQDYAKEVIHRTTDGLTLSGTMDELSRRLTQSTDPEAAKALREAGGVVADNRNAHVDLSGQLATVKAILSRPLADNLDAAPLAVAAARLETKKLAVDLVTKPDGKPGIAIVTAEE